MLSYVVFAVSYSVNIDFYEFKMLLLKSVVDTSMHFASTSSVVTTRLVPYCSWTITSASPSFKHVSPLVVFTTSSVVSSYLCVEFLSSCRFSFGTSIVRFLLKRRNWVSTSIFVGVWCNKYIFTFSRCSNIMKWVSFINMFSSLSPSDSSLVSSSDFLTPVLLL